MDEHGRWFLLLVEAVEIVQMAGEDLEHYTRLSADEAGAGFERIN